ncbi:hypothetical protein [Nocardia sp. BMG51109]|uniref:hypothetical protein n=1 Tax=Nocardia sp. BMG51109 TaxID=1056816 RepID=UPI000466644A|nr:hypothetical protein [Nocardia sp. BMG51109]
MSTSLPGAVRRPIRDEDVRGSMKAQHRRQRRARMHQRTRTLAPLLLPDLVASVEHHHEHMEELLAAASAAVVDDTFSVDGVEFRRVQVAADTRSGNQQEARRRPGRAGDRGSRSACADDRWTDPAGAEDFGVAARLALDEMRAVVEAEAPARCGYAG